MPCNCSKMIFHLWIRCKNWTDWNSERLSYAVNLSTTPEQCCHTTLCNASSIKQACDTMLCLFTDCQRCVNTRLSWFVIVKRWQYKGPTCRPDWTYYRPHSHNYALPLSSPVILREFITSYFADFLTTSRPIGCEERVWNDFHIEWDIKP